MKLLKRAALGGLFLAGLTLSNLSFADDNEETVKSNTSKNPVTGTVTKTREHHKKMKNPDGTESKRKVKEKEKHHTDGKVEKEVKAESSEN